MWVGVFVLFQCVDCVQFVVGEDEVEYVEVFCDVCWCYGFGDYDVVLLQVLVEYDLCWGFCVLFGDFDDGCVVEYGVLCERVLCFGCDVLGGVCFDYCLVLQCGVEFDLVYCWDDVFVGCDLFEVCWFEV